MTTDSYETLTSKLKSAAYSGHLEKLATRMRLLGGGDALFAQAFIANASLEAKQELREFTVVAVTTRSLVSGLVRMAPASAFGLTDPDLTGLASEPLTRVSRMLLVSDGGDLPDPALSIERLGANGDPIVLGTHETTPDGRRVHVGSLESAVLAISAAW